MAKTEVIYRIGSPAEMLGGKCEAGREEMVGKLNGEAGPGDLN